MPAPDGLDRLVEPLQEAGPVPPGQGRGAARPLARVAKLRQQVAGGQGLADVVLVEGAPAGAEVPTSIDTSRSACTAP